MRRRIFVLGTLLGAGAAAGALWARRPRAGGPVEGRAERLPDGRWLVRDAGLAFGTSVSIAAVHEDPARAAAAIGAALAEVRDVDALLTVFRPDSQVGRLNAEGTLRHPAPHLLRVLDFSQRLAALSDGAFDVTVQPLWLLGMRCQRLGRPPTREEVEAARARVGWTGLEVSPARVALARPGMGITLNGVAQGYATDLALGALRAGGVEDALLDTGELGAEGEREPGRPWTVGLRHPRRPDAVVARVAMDGRVLATSGDYAAPFTADFACHHLFDPRTGRSPTGLSSVAVAAPCGMEADALTKPMMVLDRPRALALLDRFPGAGAVFLDKAGAVVGVRGIRLEDA
jgi:thiamine biosynthesis lipoprotein